MKRRLLWSALAFGLATPAVADSGLYDWTGFYIGADAGLGSADFSLGGESTSADTTEFGLLAGYNYDMGSWVAGGEVSFDNGTMTRDGVSESLDYTTSRLAARAGYELGQALVFGTLGWASTTLTESGDSADASGMTYGLGVDYLFGDNFILGADYVVDRYDDVEDIGGLDMDLGTFRIRASYRF